MASPVTYIIHRIGDRKNGSNFNTPEEIKGLPKGSNITLDGVYEDIWKHKQLFYGHQVTLFPSGDHIGGNNGFDDGQPFGTFLGWDDLFYLCKEFNFKLGWHSWSHRDLTALSRGQKWREIRPPIPMESFAYPYGKFDDECIELVQTAGYKEAFSVRQGDGSQFQKQRMYLNW